MCCYYINKCSIKSVAFINIFKEITELIMTNKSERITHYLLAAGGAAIGIFLIAKYHKNIVQKLTKTKNVILYKYAKIQRTDFDLEIIEDTNNLCATLAKLKEHCNEFPVLGFDCEWVSVNSQRRKIALIQLCSSQGLCALIRVCKFSRVPRKLIEILEDPEILKVGVAPNNDATYLLQDYAITMNSTFDLRFLALLSKKKAEGLGKLSETILGIKLEKHWRVRCSDWEAEKLSQQQIDYAAKDAFVAIEIFRKLFSALLPKAIEADSIRRFCENYTDVPFNNKLSRVISNQGGGSAVQKLLQKSNANSKTKTRAYSSRSTPLYHNCMLQAPDGELLCTIDRQKAEWYVKKDLGTEISQEPTYTVRLNFEPAGRASGEVGEYYRNTRENRCVVCGQTEYLIRKNVIPHEYRKFFPNVMKDKTSHDVLLLCVNCHTLSNIYDLKMRRKLEKECDAPIKDDIDAEDAKAAKKLVAEQRLARAFFYQKNIPEKRKEDLRSLLQKAYPNEEINEDFAKKLLTMETPKLGRFSQPHGEIVVKRYKEVGLVKLEMFWRQHFIDSMDPKYMPKLWDVNHNGNRLEIRAKEGRVEDSDLIIAGVDAIIMPRKVPARVITPQKKKNDEPIELENKEIRDDDEGTIDVSSDWGDSYHSARNSSEKTDLDRTLTEDDRYFSDVASARSFYETVRSDNSTLDDFRSFTSSLTERPLHDSDESSACSQNLSFSSDTEIEDDHLENMLFNKHVE